MPPLNRKLPAGRGTRGQSAGWEGCAGRGAVAPLLLFFDAGCGAVQEHGRPLNLGGAGELGAPAEVSVSVGGCAGRGVFPPLLLISVFSRDS
jgi:hypothetical protein